MRRLSVAEAIREAIAEEMRRDRKVFCIPYSAKKYCKFCLNSSLIKGLDEI